MKTTINKNEYCPISEQKVGLKHNFKNPPKNPKRAQKIPKNPKKSLKIQNSNALRRSYIPLGRI